MFIRRLKMGLLNIWDKFQVGAQDWGHKHGLCPKNPNGPGDKILFKFLSAVAGKDVSVQASRQRIADGEKNKDTPDAPGNDIS